MTLREGGAREMRTAFLELLAAAKAARQFMPAIWPAESEAKRRLTEAIRRVEMPGEDGS